MTRLLEVARTLTVDATTAEVVRALDAAGCESLLLKGPALARSLYADGTHRSYADTDLLVPPGELARAAAALAGLGFKLVLDHRDHRNVSEPHAQEWARAQHERVDLHWRVAGCGVPDDRCWEVMSAHAESTEVGGAKIQMPTRPAIALIAALHAAHHGTTTRKPLEDLDRATRQLDAATWDAAAALAGELEAEDAFAAGLRLAPTGAALADRLPLGTRPLSAHRRLMASSQPPGSLGLLRIVELRGTSRFSAIRASLFPAASYMRASHPSARHGWPGLLLAYAVRIVARARTLDAAIRAVRAARR